MQTKSASSFLNELRASDRAAFDEVKQKQEVMFTESTGGQPPMSEETIVLLTGRPVLDIQSGAAVLDLNNVDSQLWKNRLQSSLGMLKNHVPAVGRIELLNSLGGGPFIGTGWVLHDDIVVTNRHVARLFAERNGARFGFVPGFDGTPVKAMIDFIEEFGSSTTAEYPIFEVVHIEDSSGPDVAFLRIKPLKGQSLPKPVPCDGKMPSAGDQVAVIGYPARDSFFPQPAEMDRIFNNRYDKKRLAPGLVKKATSTDFLHDCSTLGGNSGSEIVSLKTGKAVALHFAGTLFTANHAVPIHIVNERLNKILRNKPTATQPQAKKEDSSRPQGTSSVRVIETTIPIRIRVEIGNMDDIDDASIDIQTGSDDGRGTQVDTRPAPTQPDQAQDDLVEVAEARPEDYRSRRGYDALFLGDDFEVPLPTFTENQDDILHFKVGNKDMTELRYTHFSVVMSQSRRMCRYSACNIDGLQSKKTTRAGWRTDPRIPSNAQILNECYGSEPKFSRGHMTRREDPAWGTAETANKGNVDSMHVTNTVPQMQPFNAGVWLDLEDYALQNARKDDMRISVFTGPFLAKNDPILFGVKVPVTFWKVIAFIHDETGELCATGYTMSQKSFLPNERNEFVFGKHENNQRSIMSIGARAGIDFGVLAEVDPMRNEDESMDVPLLRLEDIRLR